MTDNQKKYLDILLFKWSNLISNCAIENTPINIDVIKNSGITEKIKKNISIMRPTDHLLIIKAEIEKLLPQTSDIHPLYTNNNICKEDFLDLFTQHNFICIQKINNLYSEKRHGKTENDCDV